MDVSIDVVAGDLRRWRPTLRAAGALAPAPGEADAPVRAGRRLRYALPAIGQALDDAHALYVARASDAASAAAGAGAQTTILVVGALDASALPAAGAVATLDVDEAAFPAVFAECAALFARYAEGYAHAVERAGGNATFPECAQACAAFVGKPLFVWGLADDALLYADESDPLSYTLMRFGAGFSDLLRTRSASAGAGEPFAVSLDSADAAADAPAAASPGSGDELLCVPVRAAGKDAAFAMVRAADALARSRDAELLKTAAPIMARRLVREDRAAAAPESALTEHVRLLLEGKITSWQLLEAVIADYGWALLDEYVCLVVVPPLSSAPDGAAGESGAAASSAAADCLLGASADRIDAACVPDGVGDVVLVNLTKSRCDADEAAAAISQAARARNAACVVGQSARFSELQDLCHHRDQATKAIELGTLLDAGRPVYAFEDYFLDFVAQCCLKCTSPTALFPSGYHRLKNYGRSGRKDGSLEAFLVRLIDHGFEMKATVADEYCSRTTAFAKLKKVRDLTGLDLDDEETRAALLIASRAIRLSKASPR